MKKKIAQSNVPEVPGCFFFGFFFFFLGEFLPLGNMKRGHVNPRKDVYFIF
jgi:hypothetical protein